METHVSNIESLSIFCCERVCLHICLQMSKKAPNEETGNKAKTSTDHSSDRSNDKDGHIVYDYPDIDDEFEVSFCAFRVGGRRSGRV